jgi:hypothetical protein
MDRAEAVTMIARSVHETIRAYQIALGETEAPAWSESGWMQNSSREAVEFALDNPTSEAMHEGWVASKERQGWTYGPIKDEAKKTHPSLVPFAELSSAEKAKDALFVALVQALAPLIALSPARGAEVKVGSAQRR